LPIRPRTPPKPRTSFLRHWTLWVWFVLAVLLSVGGVCLWRSQGLQALFEKRQMIRALEEQNADLARDIEAKKLRIERLKSDPKTQEVEVEKRLGRVHSGDTEFKIAGRPATPINPDSATGTSK
jgi:cell division protein FtsB